jgi:heme-degrading monooxygenase HmoA
MIELHIALEPLPGSEADVEALYRAEYVPAISVQPGFLRATLLKKRDALREYEIDIAFESEALRLRWAASPEHQAAWPRLVALCGRISWTGFDTVGGTDFPVRY